MIDPDLLTEILNLAEQYRVLLVVLPPDAKTVVIHVPELESELDAADMCILREVGDSDEPATSTYLAARLNWPERTIRERLAKLEDAGQVCRPRGERSGYTPGPLFRVDITSRDCSQPPNSAYKASTK
jgi:hypothetical protein